MNKMPKYIKDKLKKYADAQMKAKALHDSLYEDFDKYGVPYENLTASIDSDEVDDFELNATEGLASINNCECEDLDTIIADIERIFLYFVNNQMK